MKRFILGSLVAGSMMAFTACGGGGSTTPTGATTGTGYYIDSAVEGVSFTCGAQTGTTDKDGKFTFEEGKECTFAIAGIELRKTLADQLTDGVKVLEDNSDVQRFLQSIDNDGDPSNGIQITPEVLTVLTQALQTFNSTGKLPKDTVLEDVVGHIDHNAPTFNGEVKTPEQVAAHFQGTLDGITNNVTNTDAQLKALFAGKSYYMGDKMQFTWDANLKLTVTGDGDNGDETSTFECSIASATLGCVQKSNTNPESDAPKAFEYSKIVVTQNGILGAFKYDNELGTMGLYNTRADAIANDEDDDGGDEVSYPFTGTATYNGTYTPQRAELNLNGNSELQYNVVEFEDGSGRWFQFTTSYTSKASFDAVLPIGIPTTISGNFFFFSNDYDGSSSVQGVTTFTRNNDGTYDFEASIDGKSVSMKNVSFDTHHGV